MSANIAQGTTSAHAENTGVNHLGSGPIGNYLRARGEYYREHDDSESFLELPPRTRRIHRDDLLSVGWQGTTSAHAENTKKEEPRFTSSWNYLRARGEYLIVSQI